LDFSAFNLAEAAFTGVLAQIFKHQYIAIIGCFEPSGRMIFAEYWHASPFGIQVRRSNYGFGKVSPRGSSPVVPNTNPVK
jgi:hypothetical protein